MAAAATATAQTHNRLKIVNQCDDDAWAVFTPGGAPDQPSVEANSGAWFLPYATQLYFEDPGWLGTVARNSTMMTLSSPGKTAPGFVFVAGQIVKVKGAGAAGGDLTTLILKVMNENRVLVLKDPAKTPVIKATVLYDTLQGAVLVKRATTRIFAVPDRGAPNGNFRFFMGCPSLANNNNPFGGGGCVIGAITGDLANVNTLFEPTFGCMKGSKTCAFNPAANPATHPLCPSQPNAKNCGPLSATDFYDVSAVDGYTLPIEVAASGKGCSAPLIDASMLDLASCPSENKKTLYSTNAMQQAQIEKGFSLLTSAGPYRKACVAPYLWFESTDLGSPKNPKATEPGCPKGAACSSVSYYAGAGCDSSDRRSLKLDCPGNSGPQQRVGPQQNGQFAIHNTNWVSQLYALGYSGYSWQYADGVGGQTCPAAPQAVYQVTLCPGGGKPYATTAKWEFSEATGACAAGEGAAAKYNSLIACQRANMRFVCDALTASDPYKVPSALWQADAPATLHKAGYSWPEVSRIESQTKLTCQMHDYPNGVSPDFPKKVKLPLCTFYFGGGGKLCPSPTRREEGWRDEGARDWRW